MTPLERLLTSGHAAAVDVDGAAAFAREPTAGLLLLPGDPSRPEVVDVAVVLGELAEKFPRLRVAVVRDGEEPTMRAWFGVTTFPSLLFVRGGDVVTRLARMQPWSTYEDAAIALEAGR
jgi:hydrogenase-1 operon protein HyaE